LKSEKPEGLGLGLRFPHIDEILSKKPDTLWFEVTTDDFLSEGPHHQKLLKIREDYPINFHSIGLNVGGVDTFEKEYLNSFKVLYEKFEPTYISDHLCWSAHGGKYHHDLLPVLRNKESLDHVISRINYLQDYFKRPLLLENITSYIDYKDNIYSESEFIKNICEQTGCFLLLDVSNVLVNAKNKSVNPVDFFEHYPLERVKQGHLAGGFLTENNVVIDTHSDMVEIEDIQFLKDIYNKGFNFPVIIERDANLPSFLQLEDERLKIQGLLDDH
jgi:uncharacterized protein